MEKTPLNTEHALRLEIAGLRKALNQKDQQILQLQALLQDHEASKLQAEIEAHYQMGDNDRLAREQDGTLTVVRASAPKEATSS